LLLVCRSPWSVAQSTHIGIPYIPESTWALMLGGGAEVIVTPNACHWSHSTSGANLSAADPDVHSERGDV
jgi:hypothetical protein